MVRSDRITDSRSFRSPFGNRFQITKTLIHDGMVSFFEARDQAKGQRIRALAISRTLVETYPVITTELRRQASLNARLVHPSIARTQIPIQDGDTMYVCEEVPDGPTLSDVLDNNREVKRPFSPSEAIHVILLMCEALQYAHPYTCHGLITPGDVFVDSRPGHGKFPVIAQFGIRAVLRLADRGMWGLAPALAVYASPEFVKGIPLGSETDVYGLGALLYEMLTLRSPTGCFVLPSTIHPEASPELNRCILRALEEEPSARYQEVGSLARELKDSQDTVRSRIPARESSPRMMIGRHDLRREIPFAFVRRNGVAWMLLVVLNTAMIVYSAVGFVMNRNGIIPPTRYRTKWEALFRKEMTRGEARFALCAEYRKGDAP